MLEASTRGRDSVSPEIEAVLPSLLSVLRPIPETVTWVPNDYDDPREEPAFLAVFRAFAATAIKLLTQILSKSETLPTGLSEDDVVVLMATYAHPDPGATWITPDTYTFDPILERHPTLTRPELLSKAILVDVVRPLFSTPAKGTTAAGRAAISDEITIRLTRTTELEGPGDAYIQHRPEVPQLLFFVLAHLSANDIPTQWHLLLPPILHLLDSSLPRTKPQAYRLAANLFEKCPPGHLDRTGTLPIFHHALKNATFALPPLTPAASSARYLSAAYRSLFQLIHASPPSQRPALLDDLLQDCILMGLSADRGVDVTRVLLAQLRALAAALGPGNAANKHLRLVLPLLRAALSDPFVTASLPLVRDACAALEAWVRAGGEGVRVHGWKWECFAGVGLVWGRMREEELVDGETEERLVGVLAALRGVVGEEEWREVEGVIRGQVKLEELDAVKAEV